MSLKKIILVEDDYLIQKIISKHLTKVGYHVNYFDNGLDAYDYFNSIEEKPDLLITDIMLPQLDGIELMERIKVNFKKFPVIAITAMEPNLIPYKTNERFDRVFVKPFNLKEFEEEIEKLLKF